MKRSNQNTIMIFRLTSLGLLALAITLGVPSVVHAYLPPEDVFEGIQPPPTSRETEDIVRARQRQTASERAAIQNDLPSTEDVPEEEETLLPAAPAEETMTEEQRSLLDDEGRWDRRQERLDGGNNGGTTIIINGGDGGNYPVVRDRYTGEVLHSGAPRMSGTGPAEFVAVAVMFLAATGTFLWARRREAKMRMILR